MASQVLHRVCYGTPDPLPYQKALLTITPAILHNHSRHKVRHCDYPAVIPNPSTPSSPTSTVRGTLVTGLTDGDIWRLDTFEGSEYERQKVKVKPLRVVGNDITGEGDVEDQEVETETYIWTSGRDELEDGEWDFETFVKEKLRNWVGGSEEYAGEFSSIGDYLLCLFLLILEHDGNGLGGFVLLLT